jgi:hypothetical protein
MNRRGWRPAAIYDAFSTQFTQADSLQSIFMWNHLIFAIVFPVVMGVLLWAARRRRPLTDAYTDVLVFRYGIWMRGLALLAVFLSALSFAVFVVEGPPRALVLCALVSVIFASGLWEYMRFELKVSPDGLDCRSPWRGARFLAWDDIKDISYSEAYSWFVVRAVDGWKFRVPVLVSGLPSWLEQCERYLPKSALAGAKSGYEAVGRQFPG